MAGQGERSLFVDYVGKHTTGRASKFRRIATSEIHIKKKKKALPSKSKFYYFQIIASAHLLFVLN